MILLTLFWQFDRYIANFDVRHGQVQNMDVHLYFYILEYDANWDKVYWGTG